MNKPFKLLGCCVLIIGTVVMLTACGAQATPPPAAPTNTPLPPPPTEAPTSTPLSAPTFTPQPTPTLVATDTPTPKPTEAVQPAATEAAEKPSAELAETANQIYKQKSCVACHGANYEGGLGPILVGLPSDYIQSVTRSGEVEAGMPAFDQNAISDDELDALAQALNFLTFEYTGIELSQSVIDHLNQAWDALQAGDKAGVETHLTKAQEAAADAPPGVQITLKDMIEDIEEDDWAEDIEMHLGVLLGK